MKEKGSNNKEIHLPTNRDLLEGLKGTLSESESQNIFKAIGVNVPEKTIVNSSEEAIEAAQKIGFPVVMKIDSKDIPHKTEVGGVKLNLNSESSVEDAYSDILASAKKHYPEAEIKGISVETMIKGGIETFIGIKNDPMFGPIIGVGTGGILVELVKDFSFEVAPLTFKEAVELIKKTKLSSLLGGYRNQKAY